MIHLHHSHTFRFKLVKLLRIPDSCEALHYCCSYSREMLNPSHSLSQKAGSITDDEVDKNKPTFL